VRSAHSVPHNFDAVSSLSCSFSVIKEYTESIHGSVFVCLLNYGAAWLDVRHPFAWCILSHLCIAVVGVCILAVLCPVCQINPCNSQLHPAVQAGIQPEGAEELSVQQAYTPKSQCFGCGEHLDGLAGHSQGQQQQQQDRGCVSRVKTFTKPADKMPCNWCTACMEQRRLMQW
jgi:hypothetical protein